MASSAVTRWPTKAVLPLHPSPRGTRSALQASTPSSAAKSNFLKQISPNFGARKMLNRTKKGPTTRATSSSGGNDANPLSAAAWWQRRFDAGGGTSSSISDADVYEMKEEEEDTSRRRSANNNIRRSPFPIEAFEREGFPTAARFLWASKGLSQGTGLKPLDARSDWLEQDGQDGGDGDG
jgi:hypothetical protein